MNVTVFGSGYVGLVTGACLAEMGNCVLCVDPDLEKIKTLQSGMVPIYEPGLEDLVKKNINARRLSFSSDIYLGVSQGFFLVIAVGTPPGQDGSADLKYVIDVANEIGKNLDRYKIIITKSTVPVGTGDMIRDVIANCLAARKSECEFDVVSNPEFLKEGAAVDDFMRPDRIIVGTDSPRAVEHLKALYAPFNRNHERLLMMDRRSAELTKYAANAMLAVRISFMNELANIAERTGADIENVRIGIGSDPRIGYSFIYPGVGYGGSCFPKDVRALCTLSSKLDYRAELLESIQNVNVRQREIMANKIHKHFNGELTGKIFAIWGLSFKPNTDDMREAPSRYLIEKLWEYGCAVRVYDPQAMNEMRRLYGLRDQLKYCDSAGEAILGTDALIIMTEWNIFRSPDYQFLLTNLKKPLIFDGRNIYNPDLMREMGFTYYSIGRSPVLN